MATYETPRHSVVESDGTFEIRELEPRLVAEVTVTGNRDEAGNKAFRILFNYISGENDGSQKIAMTAPVTQIPAGDDHEAWEIAFMMPAEFTMETLPKTEDARIRLYETVPQRMAVVRFSGSWGQKNLDKHEAKLRSWMDKRGLKPTGEMVYAFYNSPFTLPMMRRNEVMFELAPSAEEETSEGE